MTDEAQSHHLHMVAAIRIAVAWITSLGGLTMAEFFSKATVVMGFVSVTLAATFTALQIYFLIKRQRQEARAQLERD